MEIMARGGCGWSDMPVMCITIPSSANIERSRKIPLWHWLTESPVRLLSAGGGFSLALELLHRLMVAPMADHWSIFNLFFGIFPFFIFAQLLVYLPYRLKVTPQRYVGYGSLFFLMLASQILFHLSMRLSDGPGTAYLIATLLSWVWFLRVFSNFLKTSYKTRQKWNKGLFIALLWGLASGVAAGVALVSGWQTIPILALITGLSYLLPASLFYLLSRYYD
jgi:hypothetical protein